MYAQLSGLTIINLAALGVAETQIVQGLAGSFSHQVGANDYSPLHLLSAPLPAGTDVGPKGQFSKGFTIGPSPASARFSDTFALWQAGLNHHSPLPEHAAVGSSFSPGRILDHAPSMRLGAGDEDERGSAVIPAQDTGGGTVLPSPDESIVAHNLDILAQLQPTGLRIRGGNYLVLGIIGLDKVRRCEFHLDAEGRIDDTVRWLEIESRPRGSTDVRRVATGGTVSGVIAKQDKKPLILIDYETHGDLTPQQRLNFEATFRAQGREREGFLGDYPYVLSVLDAEREGILPVDVIGGLGVNILSILDSSRLQGAEEHQFLLVRDLVRGVEQLRVIRVTDSDQSTSRFRIDRLLQRNPRPRVLGSYRVVFTGQAPKSFGSEQDKNPPLQMRLIIPSRFAHLHLILIQPILEIAQARMFDLNSIALGTPEPKDMTGYSHDLVVETSDEPLVPEIYVDAEGRFRFPGLGR